MTTFRLYELSSCKSHRQAQFEFLNLTKYYDTYFADKNISYAVYIVHLRVEGVTCDPSHSVSSIRCEHI
jgi:hypothetical protein